MVTESTSEAPLFNSALEFRMSHQGTSNGFQLRAGATPEEPDLDRQSRPLLPGIFTNPEVTEKKDER